MFKIEIQDRKTRQLFKSGLSRKNTCSKAGYFVSSLKLHILQKGHSDELIDTTVIMQGNEV